MGGALLTGWLERGIEPSAVTVVEPAAFASASTASFELVRRRGVTFAASATEIASDPAPDVIVFAVKPQAMDNVVGDYRRFVASAPVFVSIAAGRTIASFQSALGDGAALVRAMPNTPAAIRRGVTVACCNRHVDGDRRSVSTTLLEAVGDVIWVEDEGLMDGVTAVSGSGPAYVFLLTEALAAAGTEVGLPADLAERLARATVIGSANLMSTGGESAEALRRAVTSPGGTTEAALGVLMGDRGLPPLLAQAVLAAAQRSRSLAR